MPISLLLLPFGAAAAATVIYICRHRAVPKPPPPLHSHLVINKISLISEMETCPGFNPWAEKQPGQKK